MIEKLRKQHEALRALNREVLQLISAETPCDRAKLADVRWRLVRTQLQHLALEQRCIYGPLMRDRRPKVAIAAQTFVKEWESAFARIQEHSNYWTPDRIEAEWSAYVVNARQLIEFALDRMDREEAELYPYAEAGCAPAQRTPDDTNWAANGRDIREQIQRSAA
jgi:hypothetical protein